MVKEDWAPYQHPQTGPRPRRFLLRSFSTSGPHRLYLLAVRPTFYSNLLVSTCSLLYLPSHFAQPLFLSLALSFFPLSPLPPRGRPPVHMPATFGAPREWAPMFHSPRQQNEPPRRQLIFQEATSASAVMYTRDIHSHTYVTVSFALLSISLIAEDLNSQTVIGGVTLARLLWVFKIFHERGHHLSSPLAGLSFVRPYEYTFPSLS